MQYKHTNIITKDWKQLADFYIKVFDCKIVPPIRDQSGSWLEQGTGVKNARLKGAHLLLPGYGENGPTLEVYEYGEVEAQDPVLPNQRGFGHIAFEVDDVILVTEKVEEYGGTRFGEITKKTVAGVGTITFIYVRDPDGNLIELQNWQLET